MPPNRDPLRHYITDIPADLAAEFEVQRHLAGLTLDAAFESAVRQWIQLRRLRAMLRNGDALPPQ